MDTPIVAVTCDRCHRPVVYIQGDEGGVAYFRDRRGAEQISISSERDRLRLGVHQGVRDGATVLDTDANAFMSRDRFTCTGRKHPTYERTISRDRLVAGYLAAVDRGAARIGMREF